MGDIDHGGGKLAVELGDLDAGIDPERRIQIGQRLVEEEDAGLAHDGPADGNPLALAAGELAGLAVQERRQMQDLGGAAYLGVDLGLAPAELQPEGDVAIDRHMGRGYGLEDHGDALGGRLLTRRPPMESPRPRSSPARR